MASTFIRTDRETWSSKAEAEKSEYNDSIVFIEDAKLIWSNNVYYDCDNSSIEDIQLQIDNLQIGGVNLLTGTSNAKNWTTYGASISLTDGYIKIDFSTQNASTLVYMSNVNIKANEDYILSFNAYSNINVDLNFLSVKDVRNIATNAFANITTSEQYFTHKFKVTADTNGLLCLGFNPSINCSVYFKNIQLEKGNIATDWTPAPEDIEAELNGKLNLTGGTLTGQLTANGSVNFGLNSNRDNLLSVDNDSLRVNITVPTHVSQSLISDVSLLSPVVLVGTSANNGKIKYNTTTGCLEITV